MFLTSVEFPASDITIGEYAFYSSGLTTVTFGAVEFGAVGFGSGKYIIGDEAFAPPYDGGLKSVVFGAGSYDIDTNAFKGVQLVNVTYITVNRDWKPTNAPECDSPCKEVFRLPATCSSIADTGFCGDGKVYNSAAADSDCAAAECDSTTAGDVTKCCKDAPATCSSIENRDVFCGSDKVYNSAAADSDCAATTCSSGTTADVTTCCKAAPATCSSIADTAFCGDGKVYNSSQADVECAAAECDAGDVTTCCKAAVPELPDDDHCTVSEGILSCTSCPTGAIKIKEGVSSISASAFKDCGDLTSVTFPGSLESIGEYAFSRSGLTDVSFTNDQNGELSIGKWAFNGTSLTTVDFPIQLKIINWYAFRNAGQLVSVSFSSPEVNSYAAFYSTTNFRSVTFEEGVIDIRSRAFYAIDKLSSVSFPSSLRSIESEAFAMTSLTSVDLPAGVSVAYDAFDADVTGAYPPAKCLSIADVENFCGDGKVYNSSSANSECAASACGEGDVTTCCKAAPGDAVGGGDGGVGCLCLSDAEEDDLRERMKQLNGCVNTCCNAAPGDGGAGCLCLSDAEEDDLRQRMKELNGCF